MTTNNNKNYIVIGEEESSGYARIIQPVFGGMFLPTLIVGKQVGFIGLTPGPTDSFSVVAGSNKPVVRRLAAHLVLSPDGSRFAFTSPDGGANVDGVDDGSAVAEYYHLIDDHGQNHGPDFVMFSPDSKHTFHFGRPTPSDPNGIVIDGKYFAIGRGVSPTEPLFTPDSKHIFWLDHDEGGIIALYLDGKRAAEIQGNQPVTGGWYEMGSDGRNVTRKGDSEQLPPVIAHCP